MMKTTQQTLDRAFKKFRQIEWMRGRGEAGNEGGAGEGNWIKERTSSKLEIFCRERVERAEGKERMKSWKEWKKKGDKESGEKGLTETKDDLMLIDNLKIGRQNWFIVHK